MAVLQGKYGHFSDDGKSYVISDWKTPKPWANVISNGRWGLTIAQTGSGYSWLDHAMLNRITRWDQDLISDASGKYLFLRDENTGKFWSLTPMPLKPEFDEFSCTHGLGYTDFKGLYAKIRSSLRIFVPRGLNCEMWVLKIRNEGNTSRKLSSFTYFNPVLDVFPDWHREFHKTFVTSEYDEQHHALLFGKTLWTAPLKHDGSWNKDWPYRMFFMSDLPPADFECNRERFLGQYNTITEAAALSGAPLTGTTGTGFEQCATLHHEMELAPGQEITLVYCLGAEEKTNDASMLERYSRAVSDHERLFRESCAFWTEFCDRLTVDTPDPAVNVLANFWLKYQAYSCRIMGRSAYYQCGGAYGFRDQLQDSLLFLSLEPDK
ncbi:MAG: glycosyl transferase family 36, partial [Candidatus Wallbacteria bacterium]|nr:glycosyl transferase family 36 [Candidatus Wallbacteria bacterium]